jgi:hypothetical protein
MKGFKSTGNGPRYGNFNFSSKKGFSDSSGKVRTVGAYTRKVAKHARGGLSQALRNVTGAAVTQAEADRAAKASTVSPSMTPLEAAAMARRARVGIFNRNPKIRK